MTKAILSLKQSGTKLLRQKESPTDADFVYFFVPVDKHHRVVFKQEPHQHMMTMPSNMSDHTSPPKRPPPPATFFDTSIDDWQSKINDDFNQLYLNLYKQTGDFSSSLQSSAPFNPRNMVVVPEVIVTDAKDKRTVEKIDTIERKEHIFDPTEDTRNFSSQDLFGGKRDNYSIMGDGIRTLNMTKPDNTHNSLMILTRSANLFRVASYIR